MIKKLALIFIIVFTIKTKAQVVIGGTATVTNSSVSLEFSPGNKGLVLPWAMVQNIGTNGYTGMSNAVTGTLIFDMNDYRFRLCTNNSTGNNSGWETLSDNGTGSNGPSTINITGTTGTNTLTNRAIQEDKEENPKAKTSIGTPNASVPGILVLEDNNKAMILPKVASPHKNIKNPAPGMMVYDTDNQLIALFNGTVWSFLKP